MRLFGAVKIAAVHVRHVAFGIGRPRAHGVRVLLRVRLHRCRHAPIGIALAQNGVHRAAQHLRITRADILLRIGLRILREIRHGKTIALQLLNRRHQLRDRCADIRQLDDVRLRRLGQLAQLGERIGNALFVSEALGEIGENTPGQRDVLQLKLNAGTLRERAQDRQQRLRRQRRRFIGLRINNLGSGHAKSLGRGETSTSFRHPCKLLPLTAHC